MVVCLSLRIRNRVHRLFTIYVYDTVPAVTALHLYCSLLCATQPSVNDLTSAILQAA